MDEQLKITLSLYIVAAFGLFLIWQGVTGRIFRFENGRTIFPRWMYVGSGIAMLILPILYLFARLSS